MPEHQFSPAFIYNQINYGNDSGSYFSDAAELLFTFGCAPMSLMPYNESDYTTWPTGHAYGAACNYRAAPPRWHTLSRSDDLLVLKEYLAEGNTAVVGILVYEAFMDDSMADDTYVTSHANGDSYGGHAVCVIGYDDNRPTADGTGALLLVNSWGSNWGDNGFWWMSYEAALDDRISQGIFYYLDVVRQPAGPVLTASFRVEHGLRGQVIRGGLSLSCYVGTQQLWTRRYFDFYMAYDTGTPWTYQPGPFPATPITVDLSEFISYLSEGVQYRFVLTVGDEAWPETGVVRQFSVEYGPWDVAVSYEGSEVIPDGGLPIGVEVVLASPGVSIDSPGDYVSGIVSLHGKCTGTSVSTVLNTGFEPGWQADVGWETWDDNPATSDALWSTMSLSSATGSTFLYGGKVASSSLVYREDFDYSSWSGWPSGWQLVSEGAGSNPWHEAGEPGDYRIMCAADGMSSLEEWAVYGPLDVSGAHYLTLNFWMRYDVDAARRDQHFGALYSTDGERFHWLAYWAPPLAARTCVEDLVTTPLPGDALSDILYIAFVFKGDYRGSVEVDDIRLWDLDLRYEDDAESYVAAPVELSDFDHGVAEFDYFADFAAADWAALVYHDLTGWHIGDHLSSTTDWVRHREEFPSGADRVGLLYHSDSSGNSLGILVDNFRVYGVLNASVVLLKTGHTPRLVDQHGDDWSYEWDTTTFPQGEYTLLVHAQRGTTVYTANCTTWVDNRAPAVDVDTPSLQTGAAIYVEGTADSLGGAPLHDPYITDLQLVPKFRDSTVEVVNETGIRWRITNTSVIPDGDYELHVAVKDYAGNLLVVTVTFSVDNTPPSVTGPDHVSYVVGSQDGVVSWNVTDANPDSYEVYVDGELVASGQWTDGAQLELASIPEGTHNVTAVFRDAAGLSTRHVVTVAVYSQLSAVLMNPVVLAGAVVVVVVVAAVVLRRARG